MLATDTRQVIRPQAHRGRRLLLPSHEQQSKKDARTAVQHVQFFVSLDNSGRQQFNDFRRGPHKGWLREPAAEPDKCVQKGTQANKSSDSYFPARQ